MTAAYGLIRTLISMKTTVDTPKAIMILYIAPPSPNQSRRLK